MNIRRQLTGIIARGFAVAAFSAALTARAQVAPVTLHVFEALGAPLDVVPIGDGTYFGTQALGGKYGNGSIYRIAADGTISTVFSFDGITTGTTPLALTHASDGNFYGVTNRGGTPFLTFSFVGNGTIFRLTPAGVVTILKNLNTSTFGNPGTRLTEGADGKLYGVADQYFQGSQGTIYSLNPADGTVSAIVTTNGSTGAFQNAPVPTTPFVAAGSGVFYAASRGGGTANAGAVIKLDLNVSPQPTVVASFTDTSTTGSAGAGSLVAAFIAGGDGNYYATTDIGGASGFGTVCQITPAGTIGRLASFSASHNSASAGNYGANRLLTGTGGNFYGAIGTEVYHLAPNGSLTPIATLANNDFARALSPGPDAGSFFISGSDPNSAATSAAVLQVTTAGVVSTFADIQAQQATGNLPLSALTPVSDGVYLGTAEQGGVAGLGTLFRVTSDGTFTKLVDFNGTNGSFPYAALTPDGLGNFYGLTSAGGTDNGGGTFFKVTSAGAFTTLYSFQSGDHGVDNTSNDPETALVPGPTAGTFLGVSRQGGGRVNSAHGTIYSLTTGGQFTDLAQLIGQGGSLVAAGGEVYYGTTGGDGDQNGDGTIFRYTTSEGITVLANFDSATTGRSSASSSAVATLVRAPDGVLFGTTVSGGANGAGTVFSFNPATGTLSLVYAFTGGSFSSVPSDGGTPYGAPIVGADNNLYGTTSTGGPNGGGTIYQLTRAGILNTLYGFASGTTATGKTPLGSLVQATDGSFLGTTSAGPFNGLGTVFHFFPAGVPTPTPTPSPTPMPPPGSTPTPTPTPLPGSTPTPTPLPAATPTPAPTGAPGPTATPTPTPAPAPLALFSISNKSGGNAGAISTDLNGQGFTDDSVVLLRGAGVPDISALAAGVIDTGSTLSVTFDLTNAPAGARDVVVTRPDGASVVLPAAFTVTASSAQDAGNQKITVSVSGPTFARAAHPTSFFVTLTNTSANDAFFVPVAIVLPTAVNFQVLAKGANFPLADGTDTLPYPVQMAYDFGTAPTAQEALDVRQDGDLSVCLFLTPIIPGNDSITVIVRVNVTQAQAESGYKFNLTPAVGTPLTRASVLFSPERFASARGRGPMLRDEPANPGTTDYGSKNIKGLQDAAKAFKDWLDKTIHPDDTKKKENDVSKESQKVADSGIRAARMITVDPNDRPPDIVPPQGRIFPDDENPFVTGGLPVGSGDSGDPNDKYGSQGDGSAAHFVTAGATLPYTIHFENLASVALPAARVVITDPLDANVDLSTFRLGTMSFGDRTLTPPQGSTSYSAQVDLRPGQNTLVNVDAALDPLTRAVSWTFQSIDPLTGQEPNDPTLGFLPPNANPPAGEGFVTYMVAAAAGLPTNTTINNQASIVFDQNPAISTPVWTNTIDRDLPASALKAIPAKTQTTSKIKLKVSGTDVGSGVGSYSVYASDNGGPFQLVLGNGAAPKIILNGTTGHKYKFFTQALDAAGNLEPLKTKFEAKVKIIGPDLIGAWTTPVTTKTNAAGKLKLKGALTITNQSPTQPILTGGVTRFYISTAAQFDATAQLIGGDASFGALMGGESVTIKLPAATLPAGAIATGLYVYAVIDADGAVAETDKTNNTVQSGPLP